jgi:hypothetical protein
MSGGVGPLDVENCESICESINISVLPQLSRSNADNSVLSCRLQQLEAIIN